MILLFNIFQYFFRMIMHQDFRSSFQNLIERPSEKIDIINDNIQNYLIHIIYSHICVCYNKWT